MNVLGEMKTRLIHTSVKMATTADARRKILTLYFRGEVWKRIVNGESCRSIAAALCEDTD